MQTVTKSTADPSAPEAGDSAVDSATPLSPEGVERPPTDDPAMQGEGNYSAARRHRESVEKFLESTDVEAAARDAAPDGAQEADDLKAAEEEGRRPARR